MKRLALAILLLTAACGEEKVPAGYHVAGSDAAQAFVRSYYFMPDSIPKFDVKVESPTCLDLQNHLTGITDPTDGQCAWAVTDHQETVIALRSTKWSEMSLAHEIMHLVIGDPNHLDLAAWGTTYDHGFNGGRVGMANTALALHPELDLVGEPQP